MSKVAIVCGGAGFIGSHLVEELLARKYHVYVLDDFSLGKFSNLSGTCSFVSNLSSFDDALCALKRIPEHADVVFNLAVAPLPMSLTSPREVFMRNTAIAANVCECVRRGYADTLVHFSSSEVYGTCVSYSMDEYHPLRGRTPYAASKIAGDHLVESYGRTFDLDYTIVRPFNTIGPRQNSGSYAGVIPSVVGAILSGRRPTITGDGFQTRDYSYVKDIAKAAVDLYLEPESRGQVVNVGSGLEFSTKFVVSCICDLLGTDLVPLHVDERPGDVMRMLADAGLARDLISYSPSVDFHEALELTVEWYRSHYHG